MTDPKAICFYAWLECNDPEYLKAWAERVGATVDKVVREAAEASEGKVIAIVQESSVALPLRDEAPKDRDDV